MRADPVDRESIANYWNDSKCREAEKRTYTLFWETANEILGCAPSYERPEPAFHAGIEVECSLLTSEFEPASESQRDSVIAKAHELYGGDEKLYDYELGAAQLEYRTPTPPPDLRAIGWEEYHSNLQKIEDALVSAASDKGLILLRCGANPFVDVDKIERTTTSKYVTVPNFHDRYKRFPLGSPDTKIGGSQLVDVKGADIIALTNAVQFIVDCKNFDDAIDKLNRALMISPVLCSVCGNARFLNGKDTELSDLRMIAWEISHDVRSPAEILERSPQRVGMPDAYFVDLRDYFDRVSSYPFILHPESAAAAFAVGLGIYWLDARIKFNSVAHRAVVEFRPLSVQPSLNEDIAAMAFYLGRLEWSQKSEERLLDLGLVRQNRYSAMRYGLDTELWWMDQGQVKRDNARKVAQKEFERAKIGLDSLSLWNEASQNMLALLEARLQEGNPSDKLASSVNTYALQGIPARSALKSAFADIGMTLPRE